MDNEQASVMLSKRSQEFYDAMLPHYHIAAWACGRHGKPVYTMEDNAEWGDKIMRFVSYVRGQGESFDFSLQLCGHPHIVHPYPYFIFTDGIARELDLSLLDQDNFPIWNKTKPHEQDELYQNAKGVIAYSPLARHVLLTYHGLKDNQVSVICSGVTGHINSNTLKKRKKTLLWVGTDPVRKGLQDVLEAYALVKSECPSYCLNIVGAEADAAQFKDVTVYPFLGGGDTGILDQLYEEADVFIMPSYKENFGFVYLEAMARKIPVIVTSRGGMAEYIRKSKGGLVIKPGAYRELAEAVIYMIKNKSEWEKMSEAAYRFADKNGRWETASERIADAAERWMNGEPNIADYTDYFEKKEN